MAKNKSKTIPFNFGDKHKAYIKACKFNTFNFAEGAVRAGKTIDNVYAFAHEIKSTPDKIHLATGSTVANAKLNIGDANGFGLEYIFRGQCHWGKYKDNDCLYIKGPSTKCRTRIVIFAGGAKANSYAKIRGNSYGLWIATEINLHHDNTIKEAFNRQLAAARRKIFWDLNPDNPRAKIYTEYIDKYKDLNSNGTLLGGYNYEQFTIFDNINIPEQRRREIVSQYDPETVWFKRDILGQRCAADGLIYRQFADKPERFIVDAPPKDILMITVGVDFGGNNSAHAFVANAITRNLQEVCTVEEHYRKEVITPTQLDDDFVNFIHKLKRAFPQIPAFEVYVDSEATVLIQGLKTAAIKHRLPVDIRNALKGAINNRIKFYTGLMAQGRYTIMRHCVALRGSYESAVWSPKHITEDVRLDDGTINVDSLDACEYSTEKYMKDIQQMALFNKPKT